MECNLFALSTVPKVPPALSQSNFSAKYMNRACAGCCRLVVFVFLNQWEILIYLCATKQQIISFYVLNNKAFLRDNITVAAISSHWLRLTDSVTVELRCLKMYLDNPKANKNSSLNLVLNLNSYGP